MKAGPDAQATREVNSLLARDREVVKERRREVVSQFDVARVSRP